MAPGPCFSAKLPPASFALKGQQGFGRGRSEFSVASSRRRTERSPRKAGLTKRRLAPLAGFHQSLAPSADDSGHRVEVSLPSEDFWWVPVCLGTRIDLFCRVPGLRRSAVDRVKFARAVLALRREIQGPASGGGGRRRPCPRLSPDRPFRGEETAKRTANCQRRPRAACSTAGVPIRVPQRGQRSIQ